MVERNGARSRYHGILWFIRGIVKASDESTASHMVMLTQLQSFYKESANERYSRLWLVHPKKEVRSLN